MEKKADENESEVFGDALNSKDKKLLTNKRIRRTSSSSDVEVPNKVKSTNASEKEDEMRRSHRMSIRDRRGIRKQNRIVQESSEEEEENSDKSDKSDDSEEESSESSESEEDESLAERLQQKIKELVFFKIELPSATSNKSILNTLDEIEGIVKEIKHDALHEVKNNF